MKRTSPRYQAMLSGEPTYIGSPCKICGNRVRQVSGANCVVCYKQQYLRKQKIKKLLKHGAKIIPSKKVNGNNTTTNWLYNTYGIAIFGEPPNRNNNSVVIGFRDKIINLTEGTIYTLPPRKNR